MIKRRLSLRKGLLVTAILLFTISPILSAQDTTQLEKTVAAQELLIQSKDVEIAKLNYQLQSKDVIIQAHEIVIKEKGDELFWARIQAIVFGSAVIAAVL